MALRASSDNNESSIATARSRRFHARSPILMALIPSAVLWVAAALAIWVLFDWRFLWAWLIAGTAVTLIAFAVDKSAAKLDRRRVPEIVLLLLSLSGGVLGGWVGMLGLRHKTRHRRFWVVQWVAMAFWVALVAWVLA